MHGSNPVRPTRMVHRIRSRAYTTCGIAILAGLSLWLGWKLRWRPDYLTAWGTFLTGVGTIVVALGAIYAGYVAVSEYREKTQVEKAKWLSDLFHQFFVDGHFKEVRQKIDFNDIDDFRGLMVKELLWHKSHDPSLVFTQEEKNSLDALTDYLNFFEFVGLLRKAGRLTDADIESLFDYYVRRLVEVDCDNIIRRYLRILNFENLNHMLNRVTSFLFVYGTLKKNHVRHQKLIDSGFKFVGEAKAHGYLYSVAKKDYPAGKFANVPEYICGELYHVPKEGKIEVFDVIDKEEGVDEGEFARIVQEAEVDGDIKLAWAYAYMQATEEDLRIQSGVFTASLPQSNASRIHGEQA